MIAVGVLLGLAANQMTTNFITMMGWRMYFMILGGGWFVIGLLCLIVVKEPVRGRFSFLPKSADTPAPEEKFFVKLFRSYAEMTKIPSIRWNLLGMFTRFYGYGAFLAF